MYAEALLGIIALSGIFLIFYGPWQKTCADYARQVIFEKRDAIFDLAAQGRLSFTDPDYRQIRNSLNAILRHADDLTIWRLVLATPLVKPRMKSSLQMAVSNIRDEETRQIVQALVASAQLAMVRMLVCRSFPLLALYPFVLLARNFGALGIGSKVESMIECDAEISDAVLTQFAAA